MTSVHSLSTVDGFVAFDLDDAPCAGGTRLAPDVTVEEAALLARAMTYKFAVLGHRMGGAKGAVRASAAGRHVAMARYCEEIRPLVSSGRFATGPDLGTSEHDFAVLRDPAGPPHVVASTVDGVPFEDLLTGFGVVAAAEAACGSLEGRRFAVEGFGKVGGGVAREAIRRGAKVVAVSTIQGCVADPAGLDVDRLHQLRAAHGDRFVHELGLEVSAPAALFAVDTDVLVPGARTGVVTASVAATTTARIVAPAANVPYTADGLATLSSRDVAALPDFVSNAAAVIGYYTRATASQADVLARAEHKIRTLVEESSTHPDGPFAGACAIAERFLRTWRDDEGMPDGPPLAR